METPHRYCLGDSHISVYNPHGTIVHPTEPFVSDNLTVRNVGPILAYNTIDKVDVHQYNIPDGSELILSFGEIDCRTQVYKRSKERNEAPYFIIREIADRYTNFLLSIRSRRSDLKICVLSVIPELKEFPAEVYFNKPNPDLSCLHSGSLEDRTYFKLSFNDRMKEACFNQGFKFIDIHNQCFDG